MDLPCLADLVTTVVAAIVVVAWSIAIPRERRHGASEAAENSSNTSVIDRAPKKIVSIYFM